MVDNNFSSKDYIGIVANDAGASNLILGWIKNNRHLNYLFYLEGPSKKIFLNYDSNLKNHDSNYILTKSKIIITGTSFFSNIEHNVRKIAKEKKILVIGVIDHWVNYKIRFIRNNEKILPDIIWVFDEYAEKKAKLLFKGTNVIKQTNYYLHNSVKKINQIETVTNKINNKSNILYVVEPIRKKYYMRKIPYEFKVLDYFIKNLKKLKFKNDIEIRLRPHPSDEDGKYEKWLTLNKKNNITLSKGNSLEEDIAWANTVVGYETYALVVASASSRRCITSIPPNNDICRLMIKDLEYLRKIK